MPLQFSQPPPEASAAVTSRLDAVRDSAQPTSRALGGADPGSLTPSSPHEVYVLGLKDLLSEDALGAAQMTGWRYLLGDEATAVSSAETIVTGGGEHRFARFNSGPFVASTVTALETVADMPQVQTENVAPRLLTVPALNLMAIWVHGSADDVLVPLAPAPQGVEAGRQYDPAELFAGLQDQAQSQVGIGPEDETGG